MLSFPPHLTIKQLISNDEIALPIEDDNGRKTRNPTIQHQSKGSLMNIYDNFHDNITKSSDRTKVEKIFFPISRRIFKIVFMSMISVREKEKIKGSDTLKFPHSRISFHNMSFQVGRSVKISWELYQRDTGLTNFPENNTFHRSVGVIIVSSHLIILAVL